MKRSLPIGAALTTWILATASVFAQNGLQQPQLVAPAAEDDSYTRAQAEASPSDQSAEYIPAMPGQPGCTPTSFDDAAAAEAEDAPACGCEEAACGCEDASCCCESSCGCEPSCGCSSCDSGWGNCLGDCCLGDPCTLQDELDPCGCCDHTVGGWIELGYHSDNTGFSVDRGDLFDMNDVPDDLNLQQAWLYFEKVAEGSCCSADWGYRFDMVYGTDAQKTQAFGNEGSGWDVTFDNGVYGWAMPQAYVQVAYGDWSWKLGHFWTLVGYEVVPATGNFFYSHSYTFYNSEPFTHTGALGAYKLDDCTTVYAGWALGWDTGFDQFGDGNIFLGGISSQVTEDVNVAYMCTAGNFGFRSGDQAGYEQSVVVNVALSECWNYVLESDYNHTDGLFGDPDVESEDIGIVNYLFYTINDCWKAGGRAEWFKTDQLTGESSSYYEITGGVNYRPHANVVIRPEIRYDWSPSDEASGLDNREIFAIDAIFTF